MRDRVDHHALAAGGDLDHRAAGRPQGADEVVPDRGRRRAREQHQGLACQAGHRHRVVAGQRVPCAQGEQGALGVDGGGPQVVVPAVKGPREDRVDRAGAQGGQVVGVVAAPARHRDGRVRGAEGRQERLDERLGVQAVAQGQRAAGVPGRPRGGDRGVQGAQHRGGVVQQRPPGGGRLHAAAGACEQPDPQAPLDAGDGRAQRLLGDVQAPGAAADAALLGDGHDRAQLADLHSRGL